MLAGRCRGAQRVVFLTILALAGISVVIFSPPLTRTTHQNKFSEAEFFNNFPALIIVVPSSRRHVAYRNAIRQTWGNRLHLNATLSGGQTILGPFFFLGQNPEDEHHSDPNLVAQEMAQFGDIVNVSTVENVRHLTQKMIEIYTWVHDYLGNKSNNFYLLKTDDDAYVNVAEIGHFLGRSNAPSDRTLFCRVIQNGAFIRNGIIMPTFFPTDEAYAASNYPDYCSGSAYLFHSNLLESMISEAAKVFQKIPNLVWQSEGALFTGKLAEMLHLGHQNFERTIAFAEAGAWSQNELCNAGSGLSYYYRWMNNFLPRFFGKNQGPYQVIHRVSPREMIEIHQCLKIKK